MSNFFRNFPLAEYKFGDEETTALFQNISAYISVIDELKDDISFYNLYHIGEGERPDVVSQMLYNTPDYYWTFYYLNDHVRESGWPLTVQELYKKVQKDYPHRVVTTNSPMHDILLPGTPVAGTQTGTTGVVIKRNLDMGQLIISSTDNFADATSDFGLNFEEIKDNSDGAEATSKVTSVTEVVQYNAIHHYEDSTGEYQFFTPNANGGVNLTTGAGWLPVTYWNRYEAKNNALRDIKVLTPEVAAQVQSEFNKLLRQG